MENRKLSINSLPTSVQEMFEINLSGNIVPISWFSSITFENGKPDTNAILILSDIAYWHRPSKIRCERSGAVFGYKKKFSEDLLRRSYADLEEQFGLSKKQSRDCLIRLENLGVIRRVLRNVQFSTGMRNNILYIELVPSVLKKITYSDTNSIDVVKKSTPSNIEVTPSLHQSYQGGDIEVTRLVPQKLPGGNIEVTTIRTQTTSETSPKISLSPSEPLAEKSDLVSPENERENISISEKMISIWNLALPEKKQTSVSKQIQSNIESALSEQLDGDLENWQKVCDNFKSSCYLMGEVDSIRHKPNLSWLLDPRKSNVTSVLAREQWTFGDRSVATKPSQNIDEAEAEIESSSDNRIIKDLRLFTLQSNPGFYQSYVKQAQFELKGDEVELTASSDFSREKIAETSFDLMKTYLQERYQLNLELK